MKKFTNSVLVGLLFILILCENTVQAKNVEMICTPKKTELARATSLRKGVSYYTITITAPKEFLTTDVAPSQFQVSFSLVGGVWGAGGSRVTKIHTIRRDSDKRIIAAKIDGETTYLDQSKDGPRYTYSWSLYKPADDTIDPSTKVNYLPHEYLLNRGTWQGENDIGKKYLKDANPEHEEKKGEKNFFYANPPKIRDFHFLVGGVHECTQWNECDSSGCSVS